MGIWWVLKLYIVSALLQYQRQWARERERVQCRSNGYTRLHDESSVTGSWALFFTRLFVRVYRGCARHHQALQPILTFYLQYFGRDELLSRNENKPTPRGHLWIILSIKYLYIRIYMNNNIHSTLVYFIFFKYINAAPIKKHLEFRGRRLITGALYIYV